MTTTPSPISRRSFVATAAAAAAGISLQPASSYARILGANDRLRVGLIGAGDRGRYVMDLMQGEDVEVAAICDVFDHALQQLG